LLFLISMFFSFSADDVGLLLIFFSLPVYYFSVVTC